MKECFWCGYSRTKKRDHGKYCSEDCEFQDKNDIFLF